MHTVKIIPQAKYRTLNMEGVTKPTRKKPHRIRRARNKVVAGGRRGIYTLRDFPRLMKQLRIEQSIRYHEKLFNEEQSKIDAIQPEIAKRRTGRGEKKREVDATTMELDTRILKALTEQRRLTRILAEKKQNLENIRSTASPDMV